MISKTDQLAYQLGLTLACALRAAAVSVHQPPRLEEKAPAEACFGDAEGEGAAPPPVDDQCSLMASGHARVAFRPPTVTAPVCALTVTCCESTTVCAWLPACNPRTALRSPSLCFRFPSVPHARQKPPAPPPNTQQYKKACSATHPYQYRTQARTLEAHLAAKHAEAKLSCLKNSRQVPREMFTSSSFAAPEPLQ